MKFMFYKEIETLPARVLIEFVNAIEKYNLDKDDIVTFSNLKKFDTDEKNTKVRFYASTVMRNEADKSKWFRFEMGYAKDLSCMNVYINKCVNPNLEKAEAADWLTANYDEGQYEKEDMIEAFLSGKKAARNGVL